jgi:hypothetical protein
MADHAEKSANASCIPDELRQNSEVRLMLIKHAKKKRYAKNIEGGESDTDS